MDDVLMLELINANPGLFAGFGLDVAIAAVILTSSRPDADDEGTPDCRTA
jgi:hypothetical protein